MTDKEKIRKEVERIHNLLPVVDGDNISLNYADRICATLKMYIDSLQEEPISNDLEEASRNYADNEEYGDDVYYAIKAAFKEGAKWQKEKPWKNAQGDDLPEIDRGVIVLCQPYPFEGNEYIVSYGHRPPERWYGRGLDGEEHIFEPKTYDKGEWNIPNVVWWLDLDFPKKRE